MGAHDESATSGDETVPTHAERASLVAVAPLLTLLSVHSPFMFNPVTWLQERVVWLLTTGMELFYWVGGQFTLGIIKRVLFFAPPGDVPGLTTLYWTKTFPLFAGILSVMAATFFLSAQLFPSSRKAGFDRFLQRTLIAVVLVLVVGHFFDLVVEFINAIGLYMYPDQYQIGIDASGLRGLGQAAVGGFGVIAFAYVASLSLISTFASFLVMLGMRMLMIYTIYALFPILIAFWVVDIGPGSYTSMVASFAFKAWGFLLMLGILIAAMLGVGGAIAGASGAAGAATGDGGVTAATIAADMGSSAMGGVERSTMESGVFAAEGSSATLASGGEPANTTSMWFRVFTFFAALWGTITIVSMILGGTTSMGLSSNIMKGRRIQSKVKSMRSSGGSSSGGSGSGSTTPNGSGGSGSDGATGDDSSEAPDADVDDDIDSDVDDDVNTDSDDGGEGIGDDEPPTLREKAGYAADKATRGGYSKAKDKAGETKEKAEDFAEKTDEKMSDAADDVNEKITSAGEGAGKVGGAAASAAGTAAGVATKAAGKAPKAALKGGNLAKRGGKAYGKVAMQPTVGASWAETKRIGRESDYLDPNKGSDSEAGPKDGGGSPSSQGDGNVEDDSKNREKGK